MDINNLEEVSDIRKWLTDSLQKVRKEDTVIDKHIDEFSSLFNETDLLDSSITIFLACVKELKTLNTKGICIYLSIDLKSRSIKPTSRYTSLAELNSNIALKKMPEIIIYIPKESESIPLVELHRSPVSKQILDLGVNINIFLKENRTLSDIENNKKLDRELIFIYNPFPDDVYIQTQNIVFS